jgi:hypothetical protein
VDDIVRGAEETTKSVRRRVEDRRPATYEEMRDLQKEVRALGRRLDAIEKKLPAPRSGSGSSRAKPSGSSRASRAKKS